MKITRYSLAVPTRRQLLIGAMTAFTFVLLSGCLNDDPLKRTYNGFAPSLDGNELPRSTPEAESVDRAALEQAYTLLYDQDELPQALSLVVVRHGRLIAEAYCRSEEDRTRPNAIWSCTKSFTSLMTGIAMRDGYISDLSAPISAYLPEYTSRHPDKAAITLRQLLTMQAGIDYENNGVSGETDKLSRGLPDDCLEFILSRPMRSQPGSEFWYNDGLPILMSGVIQHQTGVTLAEYADATLFEPLGITNYKWDRYKDGVTFGAYGLWMTPRDLAKVGWMVLDSGRWNGKQIVPAGWIGESTCEQILSPYHPYGYYWWIDKNYDCYYMAGHGGQFVFIVPSKELVVVVTAEPYTQDQFEMRVEEAYRLLIPIMQGSH